MLHSDLDVKRRKKGYDEFMHGDTRILIATDIASRGLDMGSRVKHVILYEFPTNTIDYLHRIGRTARAGQVGFVTALVGKQEQRLATLIKVRFGICQRFFFFFFDGVPKFSLPIPHSSQSVFYAVSDIFFWFFH
jgi:superfamily II DNA/RNA helicase